MALAVLSIILGFHVVSFFPLVVGSNSGWSIDLFCQHDGIGHNTVASPPFYVGEGIILFANVSYNQVPVPSVLVAIQVNNPQGFPVLLTTVQTNTSGLASTEFTISANLYPIFPSMWESIATVSPTQQTVNDTMAITVAPLPVPPPPPPPSPPVGGISSLIPFSAFETYTKAVAAEILIVSVAVVFSAKCRSVFGADSNAEFFNRKRKKK